MPRILATAALAALACLAAVSAAGCEAGSALRDTPPGSRPPEAPQVFVVGLDGEGKRQLTSGGSSHSGVAWLPDGRRIAAVSISSATADAAPEAALVVVGRDGKGSRRVLLRRGPGADAPRSEPPERDLQPGGLALGRFELSLGVPMPRGGLLDALFPGGSLALSPRGRRLAFVSGHHLSAPRPAPCPRPPAPQEPPASAGGAGPALPPPPPEPSRASRRRAPPPRSTQLDLTTAAADGGGERRLTRSDADETEPQWSPDGRAILFQRGYRGFPCSLSLWVMPRDGARPRPVARDLLPVPTFAAWSPDGGRIALGTTSRADRRFHLYVVSSKGGRLRPLTGEVATGRPAWSPDGKWIAFASYDRSYAASRIEVMRPDGPGRREVLRLPGADIHDLAWAPDGRALAFTAGRKPPED